MTYYEIVGMLAVALIAIAGLYLSTKKTIKEEHKPIEELNLNITRLNANFEHMLDSDKIRDRRIEKHGEEIDEMRKKQQISEKILDRHEIRLGNIEKKMEG